MDAYHPTSLLMAIEVKVRSMRALKLSPQFRVRRCVYPWCRTGCSPDDSST